MAIHANKPCKENRKEIMSFRIRPAQADEREAIRELTLAAYAQYQASMGANWLALKAALLRALDADAERFVAIRDGALLGSVMLFPPTLDSYGALATHPSDPELRLLAVAEAVRGQGIGQALVDTCIARAREIGTGGLGLHTSDSMQVAMRMYERMGFVREPEQDFQPPGGELVKGYRLVLK
jgi:GNAT superfamily N-acetyltransferase